MTHTTPADLDAAAVHYQHRDDLPMWTVTQHPLDYPDGFVARMCRALPQPQVTQFAVYGDTLEEVRAGLPPGLFRMPRYDEDEPQIVEVWL